MFNDINFCKELLHKNGMALEYMPESIKNDKNLVIIAVFNNGYSLQFASDELRADYDVVSNLIAAAKNANLDFAVDVYPYYGSDADVALVSGHDVKHGLIGSGVYASHGYERSHKDGVWNTFRLLTEYLHN